MQLFSPVVIGSAKVNRLTLTEVSLVEGNFIDLN